MSVRHGDLRLGNVIVDEHGLAAAIDWELVQLGDPLQDLAYLCLKAWRFGGPGEAAGLGTVDELITAYEATGGRPVGVRSRGIDATFLPTIICSVPCRVCLGNRKAMMPYCNELPPTMAFNPLTGDTV